MKIPIPLQYKQKISMLKVQLKTMKICLREGKSEVILNPGFRRGDK